MSAVLTDLSRSALTEANEANWRAGFVEMMERWPRAVLYEEPGVLWFGSPVADPLLNGVLRSQFDPGNVGEAIIRTLEPFRRRQVPLWWWLFPATEPADLGQHLLRYGLVREPDLPGMAADLAELPAELPAPPGFEIHQVETAAGLYPWASAYIQGFPAARAVAEAHVEIFRHVGFGQRSGWRHYVGWLEGKPVACSSCYRGAGVAGLYYVAVTPEARGLGIGRLMAVTPLREALADGYRAGILQATKMGMPLYERLGFAHVHSFPQYRWNPA